MPTCSLCHLTRGVVRDNDHWTMVVNENQATLGRVIFALKRHETEVFDRKVDAIQAKSQKPPAEDIFNDVVEGLIGLGYNRNDARRAADKALKEIPDKTSMAAALKASLNILTGADTKN